MKKLIAGGILASIGYLWINKKPIISKYLDENELPNYKYSKGNPYEKEFKKYLQKVKQKLPKNHQLIIKHREPKIMPNGMIEQAYVLTQKKANKTYMIIPKIIDKKTLSYAIHETCHLHLGHQNPTDNDFYLPPYEKELQVEECVTHFFDNKKMNYKPRSKYDIFSAYK